MIPVYHKARFLYFIDIVPTNVDINASTGWDNGINKKIRPNMRKYMKGLHYE